MPEVLPGDDVVFDVVVTAAVPAAFGSTAPAASVPVAPVVPASVPVAVCVPLPTESDPTVPVSLLPTVAVTCSGAMVGAVGAVVGAGSPAEKS